MVRWIIFLLPFLVPVESSQNKLLLLSLDGYWSGYLQQFREESYAIWKAAERGFLVEYIEPVFPVVTAPIHTTIATGRYPGEHGVVANTFYDKRGDYYWSTWGWAEKNVTEGDRDHELATRMYGNAAEFIWSANEREGGRSGVYRWPIAGARFENYWPMKFRQYRNVHEAELFSDEMLAWIDPPDDSAEEPVNLLIGYWDDIDTTVHDHGTNSTETRDIIREYNGYVQYLLDRIDASANLKDLNVIITADHGHHNVPQDQMMVLYDHVNPLWVKEFLYPNVYAEPEYLTVLGDALRLIPNTTVLSEADREAFHYINENRIGEFVIVVDEGFHMFETQAEKDAMTYATPASHNYFPKCDSMKPFLLAFGPAFNKGRFEKNKHDFHQIDIYQMMADVLGLKKVEANGGVRAHYMAMLSSRSGMAGLLPLLTILAIN